MIVVGFISCFIFSCMIVTYDPVFECSRISVFINNYISMLDGYVVVYVLFYFFCGIENVEYFMVFGYGWLMRMVNAILVYKSGEN